MDIKFTKMHGIGNDYIYINGFETTIEDPAALSIAVSHRWFGVGSDGVILVLPSDIADVRMRIFNADGSEAQMCGNGSRCVGKFAYDKGIINKTRFTLETGAGIKTLDLQVEDFKVLGATVAMGAPELSCKKIPMACEQEQFISGSYEVLGKSYNATAVSMGNPHSVIFTEGVDELPLEQIGPAFENHPIFPERVNTEFVEKLGKNHLKMRVWERGSGETMACGTGACAVAVAACLNGLAERGEEITVSLRGGDLHIIWTLEGEVMMTGPAATVCDGIYYFNA